MAVCKFLILVMLTWLLGCSQHVSKSMDAWLSASDVAKIQREHLTTAQIAERYGVTVTHAGMIYRDKDHPESWFLVKDSDPDGITKIINLSTGDVACYYPSRPSQSREADATH